MGWNYTDLINELANNRVNDKKRQETEERERIKKLADMDRAVLAPISKMLSSMVDGSCSGMNGKIYLFDRTDDFNYYSRGGLRWEISTRDHYAAFDSQVVVGLYHYPTGRSGVRVAIHARHNLHTGYQAIPDSFVIYENATDAIPAVMSYIADMIRHR
jgi:hypothetical protein